MDTGTKGQAETEAETEIETQLAEAVGHLRQADPLLAALIARVGPCGLRPRTGTLLDSLTRAIASQQLSTKAAATIHSRFLALYPAGPPSAAQLLATADEQLRGVGLSRPKIRYLKDLAERIEAGLPKLENLATEPDEAIVQTLLPIKGVGRWTVEMLLIFRLLRLDVLPVDDLGIRKGMQQLYGLAARPDAQTMAQLALPWRPYRSVACWYLWRSLEL